MALNKQILQKISEKTKDDPEMQKFIINILQEENKGIGLYKKLYKGEAEKALLGGTSDED